MTSGFWKRAALSCAMLVAGWASTACAATTGAETAGQLLAKAQAADFKCHYLQNLEREELAGLLARAEIALASQTDVATTKNALASGRSVGQSSKCTTELQVEVEAVLKDAREASQTSAQSEPQAILAAQVPSSIILVKPSVPNPKSLTQMQGIRGSGQSLMAYAAMTKRYYLARRCNSMPRQSMASFYQDVVATHYRVLKSFGVKAVAAVMNRSQVSAGQQSCS